MQDVLDAPTVTDFVGLFDAWLATNPESVKYPGPADESPLYELLEARQRLHKNGLPCSEASEKVLERFDFS